MKLYLLLMLFMNLPANANGFYDLSKRGWFWFESKPAEHFSEKQNMDVDALSSFQSELNKRKAAMIMRPSIEHTKKYIEIQNEMFLKAGIVGQNWQKALLLYPELNIVKNNPISEAGLAITRKLEEQQNVQALKDFAKEFTLLFVYSSRCPYCEKFAYVVEHFSKQYGYKVFPLSMDGKHLKNFRGIYDRNLIERLNIQSTPSLFAFSNNKGVIMPLAHGFLSADLLERNVLTAKKIIEGHD